MTAKEYFKNKYRADYFDEEGWALVSAELIDQYAKLYALQVAREAVEAEWTLDDDPERVAACDSILTRIESKINK